MATKKKTTRSATKKKSSPRKAASAATTGASKDRETRVLEAIVDVFERSNLAELEYEDRDIVLKISRYARTSPAAAPSPAAPPAPPLAAAAPTGVEVGSAPDTTEKEHFLKSPFVGTFYLAPSPEAPPFTDVGQRVSKGQTLCIIEAMKLMNEIPSDVDGRIVEVMVENGEPVQFGDPLFKIAR